MSISSRITSMEEHVTNAYNGLQGLGADLTGIDKNIDNIANVLDDIYDDLPKVTGSGTSITLDDTRKGRLESTLNGNTSQFTTTGKNLFAPKSINSSGAGITYSLNEDGTINLSGTSTSVIYFTLDKNISESNFVNGNSYTLSSNKTVPSGVIYKIEIRNATSWLREYSISNSTPTRTFTIDLTDAVIIRYVVQINNGITPNLTNAGIQIETGNVATDWEKYTGGNRAPNPEYPQEVHVVRGDNKINVVGKNLLPISTLATQTKNGITFTNNNNGSYTFNGTATAYTTFVLNNNLSFNGNYTYVMRDTATSGFVMYLQNSSGQGIGQATTHTTIDNSIGIMVIGINNGVSLNNVTIKPYVYKGAYDSTIEYEPYQGNTYNIDLPVENLFDKGNANVLNAYLSSTKVESSDITRLIYIECKPNTTYTISKIKTARFRVATTANVPASNEPVIDYAIDDTGTSLTITTSSTSKYLCSFIYHGTYDTTITLQQVLDSIQIEYGSKVNSYTPFGTTPIELGEISTNNDEIFRTSGKNLFDSGITPENYYYDNNGEKVYQSGVEYINQEINNINYTSITISFLSSTGGASVRVCEYNLSGDFITRTLVNTNNQVVNLNNATTKIILSVNSDSNSYFTYLMINKGSTATDYEPYGSGEWYTHKELGKIVLNGSESWIFRTDWIIANGSVFRNNDYVVDTFNTGTLGYSNYLEVVENIPSIITNYRYIRVTNSSGYGTQLFFQNDYLGITSEDTTTQKAEKLKNWLINHNVIIYGIKPIPTNTKITYEPLLEQLETYYHAKSRATQTNIFQENNDLPFEISASALKEWSV